MERITKTETDDWEVKLDFSRTMETIWNPGTVYALSDYVRPTLSNGYEYECTTAGQTAAREPVWDTTVAGTTTDGSVTWTTRAFGTNATDTIASVSVTATTGLTIASVSNTTTTVTFRVSGGTQGSRYIVSIEATTDSGQVIERKIRVTISGE